MTDEHDIEALAAQIAEHLSGETAISVDFEDGLRVTDLGDVIVSFAEARLEHAYGVGSLSGEEMRARLSAVSELCRDLAGDGEQPAPVRALAVRVLAILSGSNH